jgi:hypothetical protein
VTTTANALIRQALARIGVRAAGEAVNGDDAADALQVLNTMLDAWRVENLFAVATSTLSATLPANTQQINVGPAQTVAVDPRPIRFEDGCTYRVGGIDYPLRSVTEAEFADLRYKAVSAVGPEVFFYRPNFPIATLDFYPRASSAVPLSLVALVQVSAFANLTTAYNLAPGYERAIVLSLGEELAPMFEATLGPLYMAQAQSARRLLKRNNARVPQLDLSAVPQGHHTTRSDFLSGG